MKKLIQKRIAMASAAMATFTTEAMANGTALPWDTPIQTLQNNLTGPVATAISVVAFLAAGAALVFGAEDLGGIAKKLLMIVLAVSLIVFGNSFMSALGIVGTGGLI